MFLRVITVVDASHCEAQEAGDADYVRYCVEVLFPFLEAEIRGAKAEEGLSGRPDKLPE